jgi:predicted DNA-binding transcriptional regulator
MLHGARAELAASLTVAVDVERWLGLFGILVMKSNSLTHATTLIYFRFSSCHCQNSSMMQEISLLFVSNSANEMFRQNLLITEEVQGSWVGFSISKLNSARKRF